MRQLYVDYENKCQNFIRRAVPFIDALYGAHQEKATFPLQVHIFYRADTPKGGLPPEREWLVHHAVHSSAKNAADHALLSHVVNQLMPYVRDATGLKQKASTMTIVCGGDKIYDKKLGECIRVVLVRWLHGRRLEESLVATTSLLLHQQDGDHRSLLEFVPT
jgi:hypothetical protein